MADLKKIVSDIEICLKKKQLRKARTLAKALEACNVSAGLAYLGVIALREGKVDEAERCLTESYTVNEKQILALVNLVPVYLKLKNAKKAIAYGEIAMEVVKDNQQLTFNYVSALISDQQYQKAIDIFEPLHDPDKPNLVILSGLISSYKSIFKTDKAFEYIAQAEKAFPDNASVGKIKADAMVEKDPLKALAQFKKTLASSKANKVQTAWNMSLLQLRCGEFEEGWVNYDHGLSSIVGKIGRPLPKVFNDVPMITDCDLLDKDKWTVAVCEQGIGDQVLFLGALNQFKKEYDKLILICERRLMPIYKRSFPEIPVFEYGFGQMMRGQLNTMNGIVPIGSIQKRYRSSRIDFERNNVAYIKPNIEITEKYRKALIEKIGKKRIIGFSWKGGYWERAQRTKTIDIELWEPFFKRNQDAVFVCLQYGDVTKEKKYLASRYNNIRFIDGLDFKKDIDGWVALANACDEIISVSTALVHFAGAAGKRIHLLLSDLGNPFIWGLNDTRGICYPDVPIYRKRKEQSTEDFFIGVAETMEKR